MTEPDRWGDEMKTMAIVVALVAVVAMPWETFAQTTRVNVRVVAHDAKIIGDGVGGARVTVRDPATGRVLAQGIQRGGTGSTQSIVRAPHERGDTIYDTEGAALFVAELQLDEPTVVEFIGEGPLGYEQATQRVAQQMLVVPGEHVLGDGVVLELHGFIVELLAPESLRPGGTASVTARVRMLCGCPHTPGGLWDAERIRVVARLYDGTRMIRESRLRYAGEPNLFGGTISLEGVDRGVRLVAVALDPDRANFGVSRAKRVENRP
jgi:hypothetical protein